MAQITSYSTLKDNVADWLNRSDLTSQIPVFIQLAEAELNRRLRAKDMIARSDALLNAQYTPLPSDFLEARSLYLLTSPVTRLEFITVEKMEQLKYQGYSTTGTPVYYTVIGNTFESLPSPDQSYTAELVYYAKLPALTDSATTNWLLNKHPDIYLYGTLIQSAPYMRDDERVVVWSGLYEKGLAQLEQASTRAEFTGGVLKARARSY